MLCDKFIVFNRQNSKSYKCGKGWAKKKEREREEVKTTTTHAGHVGLADRQDMGQLTWHSSVAVD